MTRPKPQRRAVELHKAAYILLVLVPGTRNERHWVEWAWTSDAARIGGVPDPTIWVCLTCHGAGAPLPLSCPAIAVAQAAFTPPTLTLAGPVAPAAPPEETP